MAESMSRSGRLSAGLLMCRMKDSRLEFLLVHPGGPFWARKDDGAWSIPKGMVEPGEQALEAAKREFGEEIGIAAQAREFHPLGHVRQSGGKIVHAWAFAGDCDPSSIHSNLCTIEWPPRSGIQRQFPEIDRASFFAMEQAKRKLLAAQLAFLDRACNPDVLAALFPSLGPAL